MADSRSHRSNGAPRSLVELNAFLDALANSEAASSLETAADLLADAINAERVSLRRADIGPVGDGSPVSRSPHPQRSLDGETAVLEIAIPSLSTHMVFMRSEAEFTSDQAEFAAAVARQLGAAMHAERSMRESAQLRGELVTVGQRVERLNRDFERSQGLLDRLSQIDDLISRRPPIEQLLDSVVMGASYLIDADDIDIHLVGTHSQSPKSNGQGRVTGGADPGGTAARAMSENRLSIEDETTAIVGLNNPDSGLHVMAAPLRVGGRVVGCLTASKRLPCPEFSSIEQESMIALSMHASIALQDSRAVEAMKMSLDRERRRSENDFLTGLPNRLTVLERIDRQLEYADTVPVTVLFVDIDHFKMTNDALGHRSGDEVLTVVADRIRAAVREVDTVGRLAADEFVVVCSGITDIGAGELAHRIQERVTQPMRVSGRSHSLTVSIGIAAGSSAETAEKVVANADLAASRAKELGRARVETFDSRMRQNQRARQVTLQELRVAIRNDQLGVFLQPVVTLPERRVVSFEALVRWRHPRRGLVGPDEFVPLAEESELIAEIDRLVIDTTLDLLSRQIAPRPVAVNISARTLAEPGLADWFRSRLDAREVDPKYVVAEITETVLLAPTRSTTHELQELRDLGVKVMLDDFGTGYSSLSTLQNFDVDGVKIDRSFVSILGEDVRADAIVNAVFHMAAAIGLTVVAEGVETDAQADHLVRIRDDSGVAELCGQGFLFGRPTEWPDLISGLLEVPVATRSDSSAISQ